MKVFFHTLLLAAVLTRPALAQTELAGIWQGRLETAPNTSLTIQFVITAAPGGGYSTIVTSPDSGAIKNVRAASVKFADNRLTVDVPALSGGYAGTLRNGVLEGEWSQEGAKLPLSLRPYRTPTLTQADIKALQGEWFGKINTGAGELTLVFRFSSADGTLRAVMDVPEQGGRDLPTEGIALDDGHFSLKVPAVQGEITGVLKGEQIAGQWKQMGNPLPITLKKGKYVPVLTYLDLPAPAREKLEGRWMGTFGPLALILRFETDAKGRTLGFIDSPQQNANISITEAQLEGSKLTVSLSSIGGKYVGELDGNKLTGEWTQRGLPQPSPLVFTRSK